MLGDDGDEEEVRLEVAGAIRTIRVEEVPFRNHQALFLLCERRRRLDAGYTA